MLGVVRRDVALGWPLAAGTDNQIEIERLRPSPRRPGVELYVIPDGDLDAVAPEFPEAIQQPKL